MFQSTLGGTLLATFTYDPSGIPESVVVGTDLVNGPRYYYVYNGHGDVVALTDASGTVVASYSYDVWGNLTSASESIPNANGWSNPYRYDGKDGARYDLETGLYWLSTRAYDPTLGRFVQRDPLGRAPLFFADQPYAYAGNNPLVNVDPSGELIWHAGGLTARQQVQAARVVQRVARVQARQPRHPAVHPQTKTNSPTPKGPSPRLQRLRADAAQAISGFQGILDTLHRFVDAIERIEDDLPIHLPDGLNPVFQGINAVTDEFHFIQSLYRDQEKWSDSDWTAGNVWKLNSLIFAGMAMISISVVLVTMYLEQAVDALTAAAAETPWLVVAIFAAGHLLEVGAVAPWAVRVSTINLFSSHIVLSTLSAELHDL